ncbi:hypothetical protein Tco_1109975 [Tanacetum coccineum]|uniref:Uncharacterized protein n=1 Tax=Tanacetum coccineum TaxID=301880 RepID=A0ABQ5IHI1_9ASTR
MSDSDESGITYTEVSSPFEDLSDIGSPRADDHEYLELPGMPEDPYVEAALQAPPSPDYVPGPEEPEQAPPSPDYIPGPEHTDDEIVAEDQPDAEDASPTAQSPDYVPESDPEADPPEERMKKSSSEEDEDDRFGMETDEMRRRRATHSFRLCSVCFTSRLRRLLAIVYSTISSPLSPWSSPLPRLPSPSQPRIATLTCGYHHPCPYHFLLRSPPYATYLHASRSGGQPEVDLTTIGRVRRAHVYTRHQMETEAKLSREAWRRSMDASDLARGEVISLRTTVLGTGDHATGTGGNTIGAGYRTAGQARTPLEHEMQTGMAMTTTLKNRERCRRTERIVRECTYQDFMKCKPLYFKGTEGVVELIQWFERIETVFRISNCSVENQIKFSTCTLSRGSSLWNSHVFDCQSDVAYAMDMGRCCERRCRTSSYKPAIYLRKIGFGMVTSWREEDLIREIDLYMPIYQCRLLIFHRIEHLRKTLLKCQHKVGDFIGTSNSDSVKHLCNYDKPPPFGTTYSNTGSPNPNRVDTMPTNKTINTMTTPNVAQNTIDENLPQLLDSRGGSHVTNVPAFDKEDFTRSNAESRLANQDKRLKSIIISCLPNDVIKSVIKCKTVKEMWNDLILAHEGSSDTRDTKIAALRLKFNAFKSLEGEKVNGTFIRLKCLLNDLENNGVSIPQAEVNATFVNSLPRKWLSMKQTQRANNSIKNDCLTTLYGKYNYEEGLIDHIYESEAQRFNIPALSSKALISNNHFQDSDSDVEEDQRTNNELVKGCEKNAKVKGGFQPERLAQVNNIGVFWDEGCYRCVFSKKMTRWDGEVERRQLWRGRVRVQTQR